MSLDFVAYLQKEGGNGDVSAAELVLGELIGNVVRYAPGPAQVVADIADSYVTIQVVDRGSGFTLARVPKPDLMAERGREQPQGRGSIGRVAVRAVLW